MYAPKVTFSPQRPSSTVRLCIDCKFYRSILFKETGICSICGDIDLINGKREFMLAENARASLCEEAGNFFIPSSEKLFPILFYPKDIEFFLTTTNPILISLLIFIIIPILILKFSD